MDNFRWLQKLILVFSESGFNSLFKEENLILFRIVIYLSFKNYKLYVLADSNCYCQDLVLGFNFLNFFWLFLCFSTLICPEDMCKSCVVYPPDTHTHYILYFTVLSELYLLSSICKRQSALYWITWKSLIYLIMSGLAALESPGFFGFFLELCFLSLHLPCSKWSLCL